jgi:hypothetical protein
MKKLVFVIVALVTSSYVFAHDHMDPKPMPADFVALEKLVGHWEGIGKMNGKDEVITTDYKMTSGGTAMIETLSAGTPHEMTSVYHADGKSVAMTHYCMLGNHPKMTLKKADDKSFLFEVAGHDGLSSAKEMHMHSLLVTINSPTQMTEEWVNFDGGKSNEKVVFNFTKK